jgi:radical SAM/Cys-rich protein
VALPTLLNSRSPLAAPGVQRATLESLPVAHTFEAALGRAGFTRLAALEPTVLQINVGKRCNQACHHCHVDAGPDRTEVMTEVVVDAVLDVLAASSIQTLDITGGAPELHPRFRDIVRRARAMDRHVIDRCNLTVTTLPNYQDLPEFFAEHHIEVIASLPAYAASQTDRQRGDGVFEQSVRALQRLNAVGYGREGSGLVLNLVTNPVGAFLPPSQTSLEREWKRELAHRHGITFDRLFTITNMPISRYLEWLEHSGNLERYLTKLVNAFNPAAVDGLMCRFTVSVGWDGRLYDCDFNQMLELGVAAAAPQTIFDLREASFSTDGWRIFGERAVVTGPHCYGCTAGAGSSCGGATVK